MAHSISIGTAWTEAAAFVAREKRLLAPVVLALMVLPVTVSELIQPDEPLKAASAIEPWMLVALVALLLGVAGQMAVSRMAMGTDRSLGGTIALALRLLPSAMASVVLFFLLLSLVLVPLIVVMTIAGGGGAGRSSTGGSALVNGVTLLLVFAMIPRILLAPAIAMRERLRPWSLMLAAWRATSGNYWRLLGFFVLFLIASVVVAVAVAAVVGSLATIAFGKPEPMTVARLLVALAGGLVQSTIATLYAAMIGRILVQQARSSSNGI